MAPRAVLKDGWKVGAIAAVVIGVGVLASGSGPMNGDMAVYLNQAETSAPFDRWTHAGFILFLMVFQPLALDLSLIADWLAAICLAVGVVSFSYALTPRERSPTLAAALLGALVLPSSGFGEVDPVWFALSGLGLWCTRIRLAGVALGAAVCISPTALALVPFGIWNRFDTRWAGSALALLALSVGSMGAWWWGTRGVALGWSPAPGRWLGWLVPLLLLCPLRYWPSLLLGLPALLAPGDIPGHWILGLPLIRGITQADLPSLRRQILPLVLLGLWGYALLSSRAERTRVRDENQHLQAMAEQVEPGDGLLGPWSWAVRLGLRVNDRIPQRGPSGCPATARVFTPSGEVLKPDDVAQNCDAILWIHYSDRNE